MSIRLRYKSEYQAFHDAKRRCNQTSHKQYANYGGRDIEFRFNSFEEFLDEVGPKDLKTVLDRVNNEGHYEVGNIRWATYSESNSNTRKESKPRKHSSSNCLYVSWHKPKAKWCVQITQNGKQKTMFYSDDYDCACGYAKGFQNV